MSYACSALLFKGLLLMGGPPPLAATDAAAAACSQPCPAHACSLPHPAGCWVGHRRLSKAMQAIAPRARVEPEWRAYLLDASFQGQPKDIKARTCGSWCRASIVLAG